MFLLMRAIPLYERKNLRIRSVGMIITMFSSRGIRFRACPIAFMRYMESVHPVSTAFQSRYIKSFIRFMKIKMSLERFFTDLLQKATAKDKTEEYHKDFLAAYYTEGKNRDRILAMFPKEIRMELKQRGSGKRFW